MLKKTILEKFLMYRSSIYPLDCNTANNYTLSIEELQSKDSRSTLNKFLHYGLSYIREATFMMTSFYRELNVSPEYWDPANKAVEWKKGNKGLVILVHGLRGHPSHFDRHIELIRKHCPDFEVIAPYVHKKGDCSLEEATTPILNIAKDYGVKHPDNLVCLIGFSNGARITVKMALELAKLPISIKVSTIAGVHFGTEMVNLFHRYKIDSYFFGEDIVKELQYGSELARLTIEKMRSVEAKGKISWEFYSSSNDRVIAPFTSSLPFIENATYYSTSGYGHCSLVEFVCEHQIEKCVEWINNHSKEHVDSSSS
ncbi:MAG: hypothetical protein JHC93_05555 [Parachlamydiales bacterium]|nr:hypothetical protein [Parachlamydiales bacterium]